MTPQVGDVWYNNRRGYRCHIIATPLWSDSPDENNLERWVVFRNISTGEEYCRSTESFLGQNRDGEPRYTKVWPK